MEKGWIGLCDDEGNEKRRVEMGRKGVGRIGLTKIYFRKSRKVKRGEKREGVVMRVEG